MLAGVLHGREDLRVEEVPEPSPGPGEVKLRVAFNGICGSDLHMYNIGLELLLRLARPMVTELRPQILGHEFSATVVGLGDDVRDLEIGTRVTVRPQYFCGSCEACLAGVSNTCEKTRFHGVAADGGGLSQFTVVPRSFVFPLPDSITLADGALVEPMAVALEAVELARLEPDGRAVVLGAGPIGLGVLLCLRATGIEHVSIIEPSPSRRATAELLGATDTFDPSGTDAAREYRRRAGRGADVAFECAGTGEAFRAALELPRPRGRIVKVALYEKPIEISPGAICSQERELVGSSVYAPGVYERVIELMSTGAFPSKAWVERIELGGVVEHGFEVLRRGEANKLLVALDETDR